MRCAGPSGSWLGRRLTCRPAGSAAAAERAIAAAADAGIDADALAEHLQRHGAGAFTADWAGLLTAIKEKAAKLTT